MSHKAKSQFQYAQRISFQYFYKEIVSFNLSASWRTVSIKYAKSTQ